MKFDDVFRLRSGAGCALVAFGCLWVSAAQAARPDGIDVSHWEGTINWTSVKNGGYVFAFTKATESVNFTDSTMHYNMTNGRAAGVLMGVFHFARPEYGNSATAEANYFVQVAGRYMSNGWLRPVLDLETGSGLGKTALSTWVNTFNQRVETLTGVKPIIYTGLNYAQNYLNTTVTNWPLWIAVWPTNPDPQNGNPGTGVWPAWAFWQYTDKGTVPGISSATDLNVFNGTLAGLAEYVIGGNSNPPSITQHPVDRSVILGGTATFTVSAIGSGTLAYQWQKNNATLANGGHYSGSTTATLTISNADSNDLANYRCVVTNAFGSATSSNAALAITTSCQPEPLVNASFEGGSTGGVGDGWTGYQRAPLPVTSWSLQTASPPSGGGSKYQQIANTSSSGGGGVRQDILNCTVGASYTISGWMRGNSTLLATCTVKVSPTASTNWATAIHLTPAQTYTGTSWTAFSGTVVATAPTMTLWLDGQTGGTGENKAECFDAINVACASSPSPPPAPTASAATSITNNGFTANWSAASGATSYRLDVSTNVAFGNFVSGYQNLDVSNVTSRVVSGLNAGTTHYYRVRAANTGGISTNSGTITVTTLPNPPAAPVATAASGITSSGFTANWNVASGATGYRLDVSTNAAFSNFISGHQNLDVGNGLNRTVNGLSDNTTYFYRLRAYNSGGTSGNSSSIAVTTIPATPPVLGCIQTAGQLVFFWPTNFAGFALEYTTNLPPENWTPASPSPMVVGGNHFVTNTPTGKERYYRLKKP